MMCQIDIHCYLLITYYLSMQKLVDLPNLLIYNFLSKLAFRFCPPFVHENFEVDILLHFNAECCI